MPYDKRGYFYYGYRIGKKVHRLYFGRGLTADLASHMIESHHRKLTLQAQAQQAADQLEQTTRQTEESIQLALQAALLSIGYHRHDRGPWRKWRNAKPNRKPTQDPDSPGSSGEPPSSMADQDPAG